MADKRMHAQIFGRVQSVFFRAYTQEEARRLGLTGWVRNRTDGSVEAVFEGESEAVDRLAAWLRQGPPMARVDRIELEEEPATGELTKFIVRY